MVSAEKNNAGMDWVIFTDHSFAIDSTDWNKGYINCSNYNTNSFKCLYGQEMSIGNGCGGSHYLAYPFSSDNLGYIDGYCGSGPFYCSCRNSQTVIGEINNAGEMGFLAHPFDSGLISFPWQNWSVKGFTGLEIFNSKDGVWDSDDTNTFNKWQQLLQSETNPSDGFTVGIGNSDAHKISDIGIQAFTYCYMGSLSTSNIRNSVKNGNCVISNGPLAFFTIQNSRIGEKANVCSGTNTLYLEAYSNSEFGTLDKAEVYMDGNYFGYITLSGYSYSGNVGGLSFSNSNKYIYIKLTTSNSKYLAYTNPIWLNIYASDYDSDGTCDYYDLDDDNDGFPDPIDACNFNYGVYCNGCPIPSCQQGYSPSCPASGTPICILNQNSCVNPS